MSLIKESGLDDLHKVIGCKLQNTKAILNKAIDRAIKTPRKFFEIRQKGIDKLKGVSIDKIKEWDSKFEEVSQIENDLRMFLDPESKDLKELQEDALSQLSFQSDPLRCLNYVPYGLMIIMIFKIWVVPGMAILTPLIAWVLPYIFLKFLYKLPISQDQYNEILRLFWAGNPMAIGQGQQAPKESLFSARSIVQGAFMAFSFAQSLIQPIQNAMHLNKIDTMLVENGKKLLRLSEIYNFFVEDFINLELLYYFRKPLDILDTDPRRAVHLLIEQPERIRIALRDFAELEIIWRFARTPHLNTAEVIRKGAYPLVHAEHIYDISLGMNAVTSSIRFNGETHHAVLTGPNGGGKSSFMRAFLQCVLLSHSYGVAPADRFIIRRFDWISSGLRLQDRPGNLSFFETEVFFASEILKKTPEDGIGLVLYDELFHSTNPPDGIRTAEVFLKQLWEKVPIVSIVSTHVFDLINSAPEPVQKICCSAEEVDGVLYFNYEVKPGVCTVSSVKSIWDRFELQQNVAGKSRSESRDREEKISDE
jgi:hypothetical protein